MLTPYPVYAEQKQASQSESIAKKPSVLEQFMPFVFLLVILYFLFIRPNQKRLKKHQEFTSNLKKGDQVLTSGGILGSIEGLTDQYIILKVDEKVQMRVLRSHISSFSKESSNNHPSNQSSQYKSVTQKS